MRGFHKKQPISGFQIIPIPGGGIGGTSSSSRRAPGDGLRAAESDSTLKKGSVFYPTYIKKGPIETFEKLVLRDLEKLNEDKILDRHKYKGHLSKGEKAGLKSLKKNKEIIFKPADKGGGNSGAE